MECVFVSKKKEANLEDGNNESEKHTYSNKAEVYAIMTPELIGY